MKPAAPLEIPVTQILASHDQPRAEFAGLDELAASIREHGIIQPLVVFAQTGHYRLIAGERRFEAAKIAGLATVPAVVRPAPAGETGLLLALVENLQRADLTPIEEARAYDRLATEFGLDNEAIGAKVGKDRTTIANKRALLRLPDAVQARVRSGALPEGRARELVPIAAARPDAAAKAAEQLANPKVDAQAVMFAAWQQVGESLQGVPFELDWKPPVERIGDVVVRACQGCPDLRMHSWQKLCTRPACLAAKRDGFAELEVKRVVKKLGLPLAAEGEKVARVRIDYASAVKVKGWITKRAKHLRLKPGEARDYYERALLGSGAVQLYTTRPDLVVDAKIKAAPARAEAAAERERGQRDWEFAQAWALAERLAPSMGKAFAGLRPGVRARLLDLVRECGTDSSPDGSRLDALAQQKTLTGTEQGECLALALVADGFSWRVRWKDATGVIRELAPAFGVRLPKGWDKLPPMPKAEQPIEKQTAQRGKVKK